MRSILSVVIASLFAAGAANAEPPAARTISGWTVSQYTPGGGGCIARKVGPQVNVSIIINGRNHIVLTTARPDWRLETGRDVEASLALDSDAPVPVKVTPMVIMVLYEAVSPDLEQRLRTAKSLKWHFPWGDFAADMTGLPEAEAAVRQCNKLP